MTEAKPQERKQNHSKQKHKKSFNEFLIGFSNIDITPPMELKPRLGGYLRFHKYAKSVIHPLKARALCIRNESKPSKNLILMSVDLVGAQYRWVKIVRKQISKKTNVPISNIMIHFTHSHSSPDMIGIFPNKIGRFPRTDVQYPVLKHIMKKILRSGINAYNDAHRKFKLGFGETERVKPPFTGQREPPYAKIDDPIRVLKITSEDESQILAVLVNYQGHPTQLPQINSDISTEYPGCVAEQLQDKIEGLEFAAYFNGAIGDVSVRGYKGYFYSKYRQYLEEHGIKSEELKKNKKELKKVIRKLRRTRGKFHKKAMEAAAENVEMMAEKINEYVLESLDKMPVEKLKHVNTTRRFIFAELGRKKSLCPRLKYYDGVGEKLWVIMNDFENMMRIHGLLDGYKFMNGREMPMLNIVKRGGKRYHQTELMIFRFNDFYWFSSPGEPFLIYQKKLFEKVPQKKAFFNCMANDTCGYIFPWSFYVRGGYETLFSFDMLYGQYIYSIFKEELKQLKEK